VLADGARADPEPMTDLAVAEPFSREPEDFSLEARQAGRVRSQAWILLAV
jgi:hypothetical protein